MKPRFGKSFSPLVRLKKNIKQNPETFCWEWQGSLNQDGYGRMRINKKKVMCHRVSYELFVGPIPSGKIICHRCDNPRCVNPTHLFVGTDMDNARDSIQKGRKRVGEKEPKAKLTDEAVRFIRKNGKPKHPIYSWVGLAKKFGVSASTVRAAATGRQWKHIK